MAPLFNLAPESIVKEYVEKAHQQVISGKSLAVRRGSAYCFGALAKGRGSKCLKHYNILDRLLGPLNEKERYA